MRLLVSNFALRAVNCSALAESPVMPSPKAIQRLIRVIDVLRTLDPELPVQHAAAFLAVSSNEGMSQARLAREVSFSRSSADRFCARFSQKGWPEGRPGLGLIEVLTGPEDARLRPMHLTPKGRHVVKLMADLLEEQAAQ